MSRPLFRGALVFGSRDIPVELYSATRPLGPKLQLLHAGDRSPIRMEYVCQQEERPVPYASLVRGVAVGGARYLVLEPAELAAAVPERARAREESRTLRLLDFVPREAVPPAFYATPYHLLPAEGGEHGYALLFEALLRAQRVALGLLWLHGSERLLALSPEPEESRLSAFALRFTDELAPPPQRPRSLRPELPVRAEELREAVALIKERTVPFQPTRYVDEYHRNLRRLIQAKLAAPALEAGAPEAAPGETAGLVPQRPPR